MLFMKGTPDFPMCGFSQQAVRVLHAEGACVPLLCPHVSGAAASSLFTARRGLCGRECAGEQCHQGGGEEVLVRWAVVVAWRWALTSCRPPLPTLFNVRRNWPTIPQLYVNGEFVGGCDIVTTLHKSGELQELMESAKAKKNE